MEQSSFENLNLSPELARAVLDSGYTEMTGIQQKVIPLISQGRDVIGQSSTGTGKTAAFGIPAIEMLEEQTGDGPQVLCLCPTRELAMQVSDELRKFSKYKEGVRIVAVYGGQNIDTQIRALKRASVVVGTPGRIIDHMRRRTLKLGDVRLAVLDEADEMLDMGFLGDIRQILFNTPKERQTVLFSATMPKEILRVSQQFQREPEHIKGDDGQVAFDLIDQYFVEVPQGKKAQGVRLLFGQYGASRGLIFCNTKVMVDRLARALEGMGLSAKALHGDMRQSARTQVMAGFKDGSVNLLVATDVAARGIDASNVDIIVNYDIPQDIEYYVHRIGRTGRAGNGGAAFTLIAGSGELFSLRDIEDATGQSLRPYELKGIDDAESDRAVIGSSGKSRQDSQPRGAREPRSPGSIGRRDRSAPEEKRGVPLAGRTVVSVDVGREHDVTERQIAAALTRHARVRRDELGAIRVDGESSTIELSASAAGRVLALDEVTVSDFVVEFSLAEGAPVPQTLTPSQSGAPRRPRGKPRYRGGGHR